MSNNDRFLTQIRSFSACSNNTERRMGKRWEGVGRVREGETMKDDGSWFTDTIRITDTKPGHGAVFGYHKSRTRVKAAS